MHQLIEHLDIMKADTLRNYVIAGLNSSLISNGKVRYFENERNHQDSITPHTHRFDFVCLVLEGSVTNKIWTPCELDEGDIFVMSELTYQNKVGDHSVEQVMTACFQCEDTNYSAGETYSMKAWQYHSVQFGKNAKVLFFEGPTISSVSNIIEPWVNGEKIQTYEKKPYMFKAAK